MSAANPTVEWETTAERALVLDQALQQAIASAAKAEVERALAHRSRKFALLVSSGERDKLLMAATLAAGAAAMDYEVDMFFAFWGLSAVRAKCVFEGKEPLDWLLTLMLGSGFDGLPSSRFNFAGMGARFLGHVMKTKKAASIEELLQMAEQDGVRMTACQMSMQVMGITKQELRPGVQVGGAASFLAAASQCGATLTV